MTNRMSILVAALLALAILAAPAGAHARHHAHHHRLDCRNVQTMTTQWLCQAKVAQHH